MPKFTAKYLGLAEDQSFLYTNGGKITGREVYILYTIHSCFTEIQSKDRAFSRLKKILDLNSCLSTGDIINHTMETLNRDNSVFSSSKFTPNSLLIDYALDKNIILEIKTLSLPINH